MNVLNYIGSKYRLCNTIMKLCKENIPNMKNKTLLDLFGGTGTVGFNMMDCCKKIIGNDLEYYSYIILRGLLTCNYTENIQEIIQNLNKKEGTEGLIYTHFSPHDGCERMFFTPENAMKADIIRQEIEKYKSSPNEYYFLLASLLVSLDKVANTTSVYGAYLKKFKPSALKPLVLKPIHTRGNIGSQNQVFNTYAENLVKECKYDIVYIDPPYNQRQYSSNYSQLNYVALYDESVKIKGKTGMTEECNKSKFCVRGKIKETFENLLSDIEAEYTVISYNNEGLLTEDELRAILLKKGDVKLYRIKYPKYNSNTSKRYVYEYLWIVKNKANTPFTYEDYEVEIQKRLDRTNMYLA